MASLLLVLLSAALVSLVVLTSAPAWRPFVGAQQIYAGARGVAASALVILPTTALGGWSLQRYVLHPFGLDYLRTLVFVAVLLIVVYIVELMMRRRGQLIPARPGFVLLLTTNGAAFGVALLAQTRMRTLLDAAFFSIAAAVGFGVLLLALASIHERLRGADAPTAFREAPLALVTAGLIALGFMGFTGLVQE